jgi:hypothetical protein
MASEERAADVVVTLSLGRSHSFQHGRGQDEDVALLTFPPRRSKQSIMRQIETRLMFPA